MHSEQFIVTAPKPANGTAGQRSRILAVTSELPWPLNTGGHLRSFYLLRALAQQFCVRLVAPIQLEQETAVQALEQNGISVCPAAVPRRAAWREALRAGAGMTSGEPYVLYRRHNWGAVRRVLRQQLHDYSPELCYLDHLDSLVYRPLLSGRPCVIDLHNIYSIIARRAALESAWRWRQLYLKREARLLARMEQKATRSVDMLFSVSEIEQEHFASLGTAPVRLVPNGVDCSVYESLPLGRAGGIPLILFVGALCWQPNIAAVDFLVHEVLPYIQKRLPGARLRIVGREPSQAVLALGRLPGVEIKGNVPDVVPHLREARLLAVPLECGGGTRLKILEAFAAGLPVVSTPIGSEGLRVQHGKHLLITDRQHFADSVRTLLSDPALAEQLAAQGRALVAEHYDWSVIGRTACQAIECMLEARLAVGQSM